MIVSNKCEAFLSNVDEGFTKDKTDKELLDEAMEAMRVVVRNVERITKLKDSE
ncbi:MAG: hypothetical protein P9X22_08190 [Candidatus Zapsychrus exili]|nr:hypothetical protein [Candidatus Zapsychrus exili]